MVCGESLSAWVRATSARLSFSNSGAREGRLSSSSVQRIDCRGTRATSAIEGSCCIDALSYRWGQGKAYFTGTLEINVVARCRILGYRSTDAPLGLFDIEQA